MPSWRSSAARRTSSFQWLLPPSMAMSPGTSRSPSVSMASSVGSPWGSMTQTARGVARPVTTPARSVAGTAPSAATAATAFGSWSQTTQRCPARIRRRAMLAPIRPRPTIPISAMRRPPAAARWLPQGVAPRNRVRAALPPPGRQRSVARWIPSPGAVTGSARDPFGPGLRRAACAAVGHGGWRATEARGSIGASPARTLARGISPRRGGGAAAAFPPARCRSPGRTPPSSPCRARTAPAS